MVIWRHRLLGGKVRVRARVRVRVRVGLRLGLGLGLAFAVVLGRLQAIEMLREFDGLAELPT